MLSNFLPQGIARMITEGNAMFEIDIPVYVHAHVNNMLLQGSRWQGKSKAVHQQPH